MKQKRQKLEDSQVFLQLLLNIFLMLMMEIIGK